MGSRSDGSNHNLGMCLAVNIPQLILQEISGTVTVLGGWASASSKVILCDMVQRQKDGFLEHI